MPSGILISQNPCDLYINNYNNYTNNFRNNINNNNTINTNNNNNLYIKYGKETTNNCEKHICGSAHACI